MKIDLKKMNDYCARVSDYEKVADWIIEGCADPQQEVAWLLEMLYEAEPTTPTFKEAYESVLDLMEWKDINDIGIDPLSGKLY
ncbi:MAG: hypothetical protein QF728_09230 [Arenicellales bacterium]|nr:hypothetical protein [Arenicellales bacterium]